MIDHDAAVSLEIGELVLDRHGVGPQLCREVTGVRTSLIRVTLVEPWKKRGKSAVRRSRSHRRDGERRRGVVPLFRCDSHVFSCLVEQRLALAAFLLRLSGGSGPRRFITPLVEHIGGPEHERRVPAEHLGEVIGFTPKGTAAQVRFVGRTLVVTLPFRSSVVLRQCRRGLHRETLCERDCFVCSVGLVVQWGPSSLGNSLLLEQVRVGLLEDAPASAALCCAVARMLLALRVVLSCASAVVALGLARSVRASPTTSLSWRRSTADKSACCR